MGVRISALTETTTMADANTLPTDTTGGTRRISWANIKTAIFGAINGLTSKSTPVGADVIAIGDSAASFAGKKTTINELLAPLRNIARVEKTTHTQYSSTIPLDNTIPQSGEGSEIFTVSHTPTSASNYIRVRAQINFFMMLQRLVKLDEMYAPNFRRLEKVQRRLSVKAEKRSVSVENISV
jgi:hypothetical protein